MNTILVPVSFSKTSTNAAIYAADLAATLNARLHLLYVLTMPLSAGEAPLSETFLEEMERSYQEEMKDLKVRLFRQTKGEIPITSDLDWGIVEEKIEEACDEIRPYLVVMGISSGSVQQFVLGSNTLHAIRNLKSPVLVVPGEARFREIKTIGIACDLSNIKSVPAEYFRELQQVFHASLDLIHVCGTEEVSGLLKKQAVELFETRMKGINASFHLVFDPHVEDGIKKYLDGHPVDLLLMIPKSHNFLEFHNSHTRKIALRSKIPVISFHA